MNFRKITAGIIAFTSAVALSSAVLPDGTSFIGGIDISVSAAQESMLISEGEENGIEYQLWGYEENKPEYTVVKGTTKRGTLTIPDKIAGYQVREIGSFAFYDNKEITRVVIPSTVERIGDNAFMYSNIVSITVPDNVKVIGDSAFESCQYLTSAVIGSGVEVIETDAFRSCEALSSIKFNAADAPVLRTIGDTAFYCCRSLPSVTVPDSVEKIGAWAFEGCQSLVKCTLPSSLAGISDGLFSGCSSLTGVKIPDGVEVIGHSAFYGCTSLASVSIPDSVYSVGENAFYDCSNLTSVKLSEEMNVILSQTFLGCKKLENIVLPDNIAIIRQDAFRACDSLKSITIPENVGFIEDYSIGYNRYSYDDKNTDLVIYGVKGSAAEKYANDFGFKFNSIAKETLAITAQPASVTKTEGETAAFTVKASGDGLKYQWYVKSSASGDWKTTTMTGYNTDTLSVPALLSRNGYQYYCLVTDGNGKTVKSDTVTLTVKSTVAPLTITTQPVDKAVTEGSTAKFTVVAGGTGLKYQWYVKSSATGDWKQTTMSGYNTNTLSVEALATRNGYQYYCLVTDSSGKTVKTNTVTLTVNKALAITTQPANKTVTEGNTAKFTVAASGTGLKYQWYVKSSAAGDWKQTTMSGYNTNTLSVEALVTRNGYQYYCLVTDSSGKTVKTNTVTLTVNKALAITTQPANKTVTAGSTAKFTVAASGTGLTYQWYVKSSAAGDWKQTTMTGYNTNTLSVEGLSTRNGYQYYCLVTDANGKTVKSNPVSLTVLYVTSQPASVTAVENETVTFKAAASSANVTYQWYVKTDDSASWKTSSSEGSTTNTLKITAAGTRNGYQYRCVIKDKNSDKTVTTNAATLRTLYFAVQPQNVTASNDSIVTMIAVTNSENASYQWYVKTSSTAEWKVTSMYDNNTPVLKINATTARNGYKFRCVVTDKKTGKVITSKSATLTVK